MRLTLEKGKPLEDPADWEIASAIQSLEGAPASLLAPLNTFAILGPDECTYIQTRIDGDPPRWTLEYQEGDTDHHYQCTDEALSREHIIAAFQNYAQGDDAWKRMIRWKRIEIDTTGPSGPSPYAW